MVVINEITSQKLVGFGERPWICTLNKQKTVKV